MAFPISPVDGQQNIVGNVTYQYSSADNSWTRIGGQVPTLSIAGNVSAGNIYSLGPVSAVGNVTGSYIIGNGALLTGLPAGYSNSDVSNYLASGTDNANIITTGNVSGNFILGNGAFLSGVITSVANINNGTSNVTVVSSDGNITVGVSGVGNVAVFAPTGEYVNGVLSVTGNITGGNIITTGNLVTGNIVTAGSGGNISGADYILANVFSATGNVTGDYILGNGALLTGVITSVANINNGTSNITVLSANSNITVGVSGVGNVAVFTPTGLSVTGNITGGNLVTGGDITAVGNIVAGGVRTTTSSLAPTSPAPVVGDMWVNSDTSITYRYTYDGTSYFWEDFTGGGIATNSDAIVNGTSNVTIVQNSNITVGVTGVTRATFASDALYVAGNILPTSNNVFTLGSPTAQWASVYLSANTLYLGNTPISADNSSNTLVINGSTVLTADPTGTSSTTGNVQVVGNVTGSNLLTSGVVSAGGNITGGNVTATLLTGTITTASQPNITSVGTLNSLNVGGFTISGNTIVAVGPTLTIDPNASGGSDGEVVIAGNLQVQGTTTTINSNTVSINDLVFNVANNASSASQANGGGLGVGPAGGEYASLTYNSTSNVWNATNGVSVSGSVQDAAGDVRVVSQNIQASNYGLTLSDSGKHIYHAVGAGTATYTIPANANVAFALGTAITFVNMSANSVSIAITSDTMYQAGTGSTGTRTLAQYGSATALKMTSTTWMISGAGLS